MAGSGILDKEHIVAGPGFNRWLVPPAALAIHLCIGMAYGFSVFWLPLSKALGIRKRLNAVQKWDFSRNFLRQRAIGKFPPSAGCTPCFSCCWVLLLRCGAAGWSVSDRVKLA